MSNLYDEVGLGQGIYGNVRTGASPNPLAQPNSWMGGVGNWFTRQSQDGGLFTRDSAFGNTKTGQLGWAGFALGGAQSLMSGYMGMKQYGLAKQQLGEAKRQFNANYEAQRKTLNTAMEDRQKARVASNPGAYESVDGYMNKNRI